MNSKLFYILDNLDKVNYYRSQGKNTAIFGGKLEDAANLVTSQIDYTFFNSRVSSYPISKNFAMKILAKAKIRADNFQKKTFINSVEYQKSIGLIDSLRVIKPIAGKRDIIPLIEKAENIIDEDEVKGAYLEIIQMIDQGGSFDDLFNLGMSMYQTQSVNSAVLNRIGESLFTKMNNFQEGFKAILLNNYVGTQTSIEKCLRKSRTFELTHNEKLILSAIAADYSHDRQLIREFFVEALNSAVTEEDFNRIKIFNDAYFFSDSILKGFLKEKGMDSPYIPRFNTEKDILLSVFAKLIKKECAESQLSAFLEISTNNITESLTNNILIDKQLSGQGLSYNELRTYNEWNSLTIKGKKISIISKSVPIRILRRVEINHPDKLIDKTGKIVTAYRYVSVNVFDVSQTTAFILGYEIQKNTFVVNNENYAVLLNKIKKHYRAINLLVSDYSVPSVKELAYKLARREFRSELFQRKIFEYLTISALGFKSDHNIDKILLLNIKDLFRKFEEVYYVFRKFYILIREVQKESL